MSEPTFDWPLRPEHWDALVPGHTISILKRHIDGEDRVRYHGEIQVSIAPEPWVEIWAVWTLPKYERDLLTLETGDILREFYSWKHPWNLFSVFAPDGRHKGWYANVTYPAFVEIQQENPVLVWHDLLLDVIANSQVESLNLDDDELEDSGLSESNPALFHAIVLARDEILGELANRTGPFLPSLI